jgi:uncharacterized RDD family membrane protein YckC
MENTATVARRLAGGLIDLAILIAVFIVFATLFGETETSTESGVSANMSVEGWPAVAMFLIDLMYFVAMEGLTGKTVGKMLVGTRVVNINGGPITYMQALGRNLLRIVDYLLVGLIVMASTKNRQRVGDLAARTYVIK